MSTPSNPSNPSNPSDPPIEANPESPSNSRSDFQARFESASGDPDEGEEVERVETLIRLLYTLLFFLIIQVLEAAVGVIVFFQLLFALITNRTPNPAVTDFGRKVIEYGYQIGHYVTYNRARPPFPFDELPE